MSMTDDKKAMVTLGLPYARWTDSAKARAGSTWGTAAARPARGGGLNKGAGAGRGGGRRAAALVEKRGRGVGGWEGRRREEEE